MFRLIKESGLPTVCVQTESSTGLRLSGQMYWQMDRLLRMEFKVERLRVNLEADNSFSGSSFSVTTTPPSRPTLPFWIQMHIIVDFKQAPSAYIQN